MKLYEINAEIAELGELLLPDPETGEVRADYEEILSRIDALSMARADRLEWIAKLALNTRAEADALKAEEKRLKERRSRAEAKYDRLLDVLDRECGGQKTALGVATLCYRKTSHVEITDPVQAVRWLYSHGHEDCYRQPEPEISKTAVGKLLDAGEEIIGAEKVVSQSYYLK